MTCTVCFSRFTPRRSRERCDACDRSVCRIERLPRLEAVRRLLDLQLAVRRFERALQIPEECAHTLPCGQRYSSRS
jgi:hypothetical protein